MRIKDRGKRFSVIYAFLPILFIALCALRAFAQFESATLTGVVTDPANAVVPAADIRAVNMDTNQETAAATNSEGRYTFTNLRPGSYRVSAKAAGFTETVSSGLVLQINQAARLNFELTVGQVSDQVQVTESAPVLQTETSGLGAVIDHTKMVELPLNGRDYNQLALLSPGVLLPTPRLQSIGFRGAFLQNDRAHWPVIILHFDFKSNDPQLLQSVWNLLDEYRDWITTAVKTADPLDLAPFDPKPLLVLTEDSDAQEDVVGAQLRVFGSAHTKPLPGNTDRERAHFAATLPPEELLAERPTNYRRWWNNSWLEVEESGQASAGDWTPTDMHRLQALVDHAHRLGFWIRFYTLDGFSSKEDRGWNKTYNFGSRQAVLKRWQAALDAGVDMIATDQYEDLSGVMAQMNIK